MHICFLAWDYPEENKTTGGVGVFVKMLATQLQKRGVYISIVSQSRNGKKNTSVEDGINVTRIVPGSLPWIGAIVNKLRVMRAIRSQNKKNPIDVIETTESQGAFIPSLKIAKHVVRLHGGHLFFANTEKRKIDFFKSILERKCLRNADSLVAVSNYVKNETLKLHHLKRKCSVIYNTIDVDRFYNVNQKVESHSILYFGWVVPKKGVLELLEAVSNLHKKHSNIRLYLVGKTGTSSKVGKSWELQLNKFKDEEHKKFIDFVGPVANSEIPNWLSKSEIVVLPSHMEAMPIAWLETMAAGKPFIGTNIPPAKELLRNNVDGILVEPNSPQELERKMDWLLNNNKQAIAMGASAKARIKELFNTSNIVDQNLEYYKNVLVN